MVTPIGERYNNTKKIGDKTLILNTEMSNHNYVNREAEILSVPFFGDHYPEVGDKVLIHHNVFRRFRDIYGNEKNSRSYYTEDKYLCQPDQVYMVDKGNGWESLPGFTFVAPVTNEFQFTNDKEHRYFGIVKYPDPRFEDIQKEDLVTFLPSSEFEFILEGQKLYRVLSKFITTKNGYKGNKKEHLPGWV